MNHYKIQFILLAVILIFLSCNSTKNTSILEIVDKDYRISANQIVNFCSDAGIEKGMIYEFEHHWVIFNSFDKVKKLKATLESQLPSLYLKIYDHAFYNFNREKLTGEKPANEWTHIIMTANLVQDTVFQNEYMEYHRTQFEKWPEISKGFVNADFQQLLVFRNGRQLMLVISIPKGKTLDELNPKTTENNPRVDEWNKIMAKYQEGIEDAPKGSTWVMFSELR